MRQAPDASLRRGSAAALRGAHVRRQRYVQRLSLRPLTTPSKTLPCTVTDMFVWLNGDGLAGGAASRLPTAEAWKKHSLSAIHNQLWTGDSACTTVMLSRCASRCSSPLTLKASPLQTSSTPPSTIRTSSRLQATRRSSPQASPRRSSVTTDVSRS